MNKTIRLGGQFYHQATYFLTLWAISALWYGDTFRMAREYSFFALSTVLMEPVLSAPFGWLWAIGRAFLCLCATPWLGTLIWALIGTTISRLIGRLLLPTHLIALQYIPFTLYFLYIVWQGFDAFVYAEPGKITGIPLFALTILAIAATTLQTIHPTPSHTPRTPTYLKAINTLAAILLPAAICIYGNTQRPYVTTTARLVRQLSQSRWQDMIHTAQTYKGSNRQVAAYHAIALHHTDKLIDQTFNLRYDFQPIHLTSWNGQPSNGRDIHLPDCNLHAGLIQTAYRQDMEAVTFNGLQTTRLRRMIVCAILREETNLALRYLYILSKQPMEKQYVRRMRAMALNPRTIQNDPTMKFIQAHNPTFDTFESYLTQPLFIGYYSALQTPRTQTETNAATAAALYTKNIPLFVYRATAYANRKPLPIAIGDALGIAYANGQIPTENALGLSPYAQRAVTFLQNAGEENISNGNDPDLNLYNHYAGSYLYYYYFGNRNATPTQQPQQNFEGGVN